MYFQILSTTKLFGETVNYYMNHFKIIINFAKVCKQSFVASDLKHYF